MVNYTKAELVKKLSAYRKKNDIKGKPLTAMKQGYVLGLAKRAGLVAKDATVGKKRSPAKKAAGKKRSPAKKAAGKKRSPGRPKGGPCPGKVTRGRSVLTLKKDQSSAKLCVYARKPSPAKKAGKGKSKK